MKRALRVKSVSTKVSEAEYRLLESSAERGADALGVGGCRTYFDARLLVAGR
jgi:hypothetical protein